MSRSDATKAGVRVALAGRAVGPLPAASVAQPTLSERLASRGGARPGSTASRRCPSACGAGAAGREARRRRPGDGQTAGGEARSTARRAASAIRGTARTTRTLAKGLAGLGLAEATLAGLLSESHL